MLEIQRVRADSQWEDLFLDFPRHLYQGRAYTQVTAEVKAVLRGVHALSHLFRVEAYLALYQGRPVMRAAIFYNYTRKAYYLGYFEGVDDVYFMQVFTTYLSQRVRELGGDSLSGPINGSFWLAYRMKLSNFTSNPFIGEPHNLAYYPKLWEAVGFELQESYASYYYQSPDQHFKSERLASRYQKFLAEGLTFKTARKADLGHLMQEISPLFRELFASLPYYETLSDEAFQSLVKPLMQIIDPQMIELAYAGEDLAGFLIALPNYGNIAALGPLQQLGRLLEFTWGPATYVITYLAVKPEYLGLGSALLYPIVEKLKAKQATAISALIYANRATKNYVPDMKLKQTLYGIYRLKLAGENQ